MHNIQAYFGKFSLFDMFQNFDLGLTFQGQGQKSR